MKRMIRDAEWIAKISMDHDVHLVQSGQRGGSVCMTSLCDVGVGQGEREGQKVQQAYPNS